MLDQGLANNTRSRIKWGRSLIVHFLSNTPPASSAPQLLIEILLFFAYVLMSSLWLPSLEQAITIGVIHNLPHVNLENEIRYGPTDPEFATIYETLIGLLQGTDEESRNIILAAVENAPTRRGQLILLNAISARSQGEMPLSKVAEWIKKNIVTPCKLNSFLDIMK